MAATAASDGDSDDKRFDVLFLYLSPSSVLRSCCSTSRLRHRRWCVISSKHPLKFLR
ncbi:uncharacterized protein G2W53_021878 [Senna tora]|uniref:Uncharacterized protein n=1 Tax=Senna tora TaxID=362788 RepID=A0A834TM22_9FABA|nr:uncharacterized protein G2W53_021878 [Senna tora]